MKHFELDDLTLARAKRGERAACQQLVQHHERAVFALLGRMLGPAGRRAMVEDLAQETFLRVFRGLPRFSEAGPARFSTWVLTIATRLALDELRKRPPRLVTMDEAVKLASHSRTDAKAMLAAIERAAGTLSPEFLAVFVLRDVHELDYEEIAQALEIDLGTVKSRLSRARAALREILEVRS
jgi:RNA polymerase sigma-70 factor (ECF subfamily)